MPDLIASSYSEQDANNTSPSPAGIQSGYQPSAVAPIIRAHMGATKRFFDQINPILTSTGSGNAYVLTYTQAPSPAYSKGIVISWYADRDNTGPATLEINGAGSKQLLSLSGQPLTAGQVKAGRIVSSVFNGTSFEIISVESHDAKFTGNTSFGTLSGNGAFLTSLNANSVSTGTIADARLPATMTNKVIDYMLTVRAGAAGVAGSLVLNSGDTTNTGYMNFTQKDGTRAGYIGNALTSTKQIGLVTENGYVFNFAGSEPLILGNKVYHAGAGGSGTGSGLAADTLRGYIPDVARTGNTIALRAANGDLGARDLFLARNATEGYVYFSGNNTANFGFDGTNIRTSGANFLVNGTLTGTADITTPGQVLSTGGNVITQAPNSSANIHYWYRSNAGVNRAITYYSQTSENWNVQLYNTAGTAVRSFSFRQSDGLFSVQGPITASGAISTGSSYLATDGNIGFAGGMTSLGATLYDALIARVKNDSGTYNINITGNAATASATAISATLRQSGTGGGMTFNWSGQGGQPTWVWGGNDGAQMYVYNPLNFSVNYATTAAYATYLGGADTNQYSRVSYTTNTNDTNFPIGCYRVGLYSPNVNRIHDVNLRLGTDTRIYHAGGAGTLIAGTWRSCGCIEGGNGVYLYQRVG